MVIKTVCEKCGTEVSGTRFCEFCGGVLKVEKTNKEKRVKHIKPNSVWRHFKGNVYIVEDIIVNTNTNELDVLYRAAKDQKEGLYKKIDGRWCILSSPERFTRPLSEWEELVPNEDNKLVPRFVLNLERY